MIFSDEDLKRLKEYLENYKPQTWQSPVTPDNLKALIRRLEAAERIVIWAHGICPDTMEEAWRKACGGEK